MSALVRREIAAYLFNCDALDAVEQRQVERMARNSIEYRRRIDVAAAFVADMPCTCRTVDDDCPREYLGRVLAGDE